VEDGRGVDDCVDGGEGVVGLRDGLERFDIYPEGDSRNVKI
jgi:hypothetical protein